MYIRVVGREIESFKGEKVILFGCGSCGQRALEEFENVDAEIIAFSDNNINLLKTGFHGHKVLQPESLSQFSHTSIIITSTYEDEIEKQLKSMEIKNYYKIKLGVLKETMSFHDFKNPTLTSLETNQLLYNKLLDESSFFIGRLGSVELECLSHYLYFLNRKEDKQNKYPQNLKMMMNVNAGFFPVDERQMDHFSEQYLLDLDNMDVIWSMWFSEYEDKIYQDYYSNKKICDYNTTAFPIDMEMPWTYGLENKKVLVIHPFDESIHNNYNIKEKLFDNKLFLPDFELLTYRPVQSIAGNETEYETWFEAFDTMREDIRKLDFDIALIGAGAYGLPLGSFVKSIGKKAIHIGGMLQLFFGIRGRAWDKFNFHNEHWTRPTLKEKPQGFEKVEAGRYW